MDGFGLRQETEGNAIRAAATPRLDQFFREYAHTTLRASGLDVGLPDGQMGNSEVGHTNIGAGRVVFQDLPRITKAIADGSFVENPAYRHAMDACLEKGTSLHLMGLLSDGGVHSHLEHLFALLRLAKRRGLEHVYLHAFLDGRDVSPTSGADFVAQTVAQCRGDRRGQDRHGHGPVLCHGPGQALGPGGGGLRRHGVRRGRRAESRPGGRGTGVL